MQSWQSWFRCVQEGCVLHGVDQVVEGRLFSEGLHVLGQPPGPEQMRQYLSAYFGEGLPEAAVDAVVDAGDRGIEAVRQQLERTYSQVLILLSSFLLLCYNLWTCLLPAFKIVVQIWPWCSMLSRS